MNMKSVLCILLFAVILMAGPSDAFVAKVALVKAKAAVVTAPHIAAHVAVATDVKHKMLDAFWKSWAALKATKHAAFSLVTAPVRVVGKKIALKFAALKATKALKAAKVAGVVSALKKNPIIVPVPVPVRIPFPVLSKDAAVALNPVNTLIAGAQSLLKQHSVASIGAVAAAPIAAAPIHPVQQLIEGGQSLLQPVLPAVAAPVPVAVAGSVAAHPAADLLNHFQFKYPINVAPVPEVGGHHTYGVPNQ